MKSKTILNIHIPPITAHTTIAYPLSILCGDKRNNDWIYSNYVNLSSSIDPKNFYRMNFLSGDSFGGIEPLIYMQKCLPDNCDIFIRIKELLDDGWYIFTFLDFAILQIEPYILHNILIYGIDNENGLIHVAGYLNKHYATFTIEFDIFANAYNSQANTRKHKSLIMKQRTPYPSFSYENFEIQLLDYINSEFPPSHINNYYSNIDKIMAGDELLEEFIVNSRKDGGYYYGVDCYKSLQEYLFLSDNLSQVDLRPYRILFEHKSLMKNRLCYFQQENIYGFDMSYYIDKMSEIEIAAKILFNFIIKSGMKNESSHKLIISKIKSIKRDEHKLLKKFIKQIH